MMFRFALTRLFAASAIAMLGVACAAAPEGEEAGDENSDTSADALTRKTVPLKYEGTCDFLRNCSSYSRNVPAGQVTWGCTGVGACSDTALWVAAPTRASCGKRVRLCKGAVCTTALVKDVSVSQDWEASNGVLDALDLPYGLSGRCSGYGGGRVSVTVL